MDRDTAVLTGAKQILQRCLGCNQEHSFFIFSDGSTTGSASKDAKSPENELVESKNLRLGKVL